MKTTHAPEKLGEKKEKVAKKMFKKGANKEIVEGDFSKHYLPQDRFTEADEQKEQKGRKAKNKTNLNKGGDWET